MREMAVAVDLGRLAPDHLEAVDAGGCALAENRGARSRARRRWCRSARPRRSSGRRAGCPRNPDGRRRRRARPARRPSTRGTPVTCCLRPLPVSTSHSLPPFSVTSAMLVIGTPLPGRKSIAQGESKLATSVTVKGRSDGVACAADCDGARRRRQAAATARSCALSEGSFELFLRRSWAGMRPTRYRARHATLQPSLPGDGRSTARSSIKRKRKRRARRAFGGRKALFDRLSGVFDNAGIAKRHIVAPRTGTRTRTAGTTATSSICEAAEALFEEAAAAAIEQAGLDARPRSTGSSPSRRPASPPRASKRASGRGSACATMSAECRSSGSVARAASAALRRPRGWPAPSRAAAGCSSPSRPARSRSGSTATIPRRSSPRPCSATAPRRRSSSAEATGWRRSWAAPRNSGPTRSGSWAGTSRTRASPSSSTARSRRSSRRSLTAAVDEMLRALGQPRDAIARLCCHPGGVKVIDAIETALDLHAGRARPRARGASRLRQHERADGAVRARAADRPRPAEDAC